MDVDGPQSAAPWYDMNLFFVCYFRIYILWFISPITMVFVGDISIINGIIIWLVVTGTMEFLMFQKKLGMEWNNHPN